MQITNIRRPSLIVKEDICRNNIRRMASKARASGVDFRPHFKTHQSLKVGEWFRDELVDRITVSSAEMAEKFASAGWENISIAFPFNVKETDTYNTLAGKIELNLLLDSPDILKILSNSMEHPVGIFIEIDCGYGRSGLKFYDLEGIHSLIAQIEIFGRLQFKGFLTHDGNTYHASSKHEVLDIHKATLRKLVALKERYPKAIISVGDTPACSILEEISDADEIRPGNFVYYDLMQENLGSCQIQDIAVTVACPVTGIYPDRNEIVIYGGAIHVSKEYLGEDDRYYGLVVQYNENGWSSPVERTKLISVSQEHGVIRTTPEFIASVKHGDIIGILPVHSCLTANLLQDNMLFI